MKMGARAARIGTHVLSASTAALDVAVRTPLVAAAPPAVLCRRDLAWQRSRLGLYGELAAAADAERSFPRPEPDCRVRARRTATLPFLQRGRVEELAFDSAFVPIDAALAARWAAHRENAVAHAQHWRHRDGPRPTLVVLHGFLVSPPALNSVFFSLRWLYTHGYDILLVTLPFHGRRRGRREPFSGFGVVSGGPTRLIEMLAQAVHDVRVFADHLQRLGVPRVGVTGYSLGGVHRGAGGLGRRPRPRRRAQLRRRRPGGADRLVLPGRRRPAVGTAAAGRSLRRVHRRHRGGLAADLPFRHPAHDLPGHPLTGLQPRPPLRRRRQRHDGHWSSFLSSLVSPIQPTSWTAARVL